MEPVELNQVDVIAFTSDVMNGDIVSPPVDVRQFKTGYIQFVWTGTPTGTWVINGVGGTRASHPVDVTALCAPALQMPAGSAGVALVNFSDCGFNYMIIEYHRTSGTGGCSVVIGGKPL